VPSMLRREARAASEAKAVAGKL